MCIFFIQQEQVPSKSISLKSNGVIKEECNKFYHLNKRQIEDVAFSNAAVSSVDHAKI